VHALPFFFFFFLALLFLFVKGKALLGSKQDQVQGMRFTQTKSYHIWGEPERNKIKQ
jgi:hypothetical protein